MKASDFEIHNYDKLDKIMSKLCALVVEGQKTRPEHFGKVAAAVLDPDNNLVARLNCPGADGKRMHAERAAMEAYNEQHGDIPEGSIVLTTCSPCSEHMTERDGVSCTDYINASTVKKVYCGYSDPTQDEDQRKFNILETKDSSIRELCKMFAETFIHGVNEAAPDINYGIGSSPGKMVRVGKNGRVPHASLHLNVSKSKAKKLGLPHNVKENFADGKNPQDKGDAKRHGISGQKIHDLWVDRYKQIPDTWIMNEEQGDFNLMGQNLFLKNLARNLQQRYPNATVKLLSDRVTAYHNKEDDEALNVMGTEVMDSGYIGVGLDDAFTESFQGVLVPTIKQTTEQLLAANPGTRPALFLSTDNWNPDAWTHIANKLGYRLVADESLDENFADGKNPQDKGDAKRHGINTKASVSSLRKTAHQGGRKGQLAHWLANMKAGRAKK
jgi:pyrimidine deaminase RibD-like protein